MAAPTSLPIPRRRDSYTGLWGELPLAFSRKGPTDEEVGPVLARFLAGPSPANRDALVVVFLPSAMRLALWMHRTGRAPRTATPDELISDATVGLLSAVDQWPRIGERHAGMFRSFIRAVVMRQVWSSHRDRTWGGHASVKKMLAKRVRRQFVREAGRLPTPDEFRERLAALITNPNIQVGDGAGVGRSPSMVPRRGMDLIHQDQGTASEVAAEVDPAPAVGSGAMDADTVRLAMKGLNAEDRKILRRILAGDGTNDIARMLGVEQPAATKRINAVLWQGRCRADLARCLGVVPEPVPAPMKSGCLPSPKNLPPARKAV